MAAVKTNLRELSVGAFFFFGKNEMPISPVNFLGICKNNIANCSGLSVSNIALNEISFTLDEIQIIKNGLKLGKAIQETFKIGAYPKISWVGKDAHSGVSVDLIINEFCFSLKEDSRILENMGLYKLINLIIGKEEYKRGLHVFEEFAPAELHLWFETTRDLLLSLGPIPYSNPGTGYTSEVKLDKNTLYLRYVGVNKIVQSQIVDFPSCDYPRFEKSTISLTREKVFSKWVKERVEDEPEYMKTKRNCSIEAGTEIVKLLKPFENTSPVSLLRLFREQVFYYAKTTTSGGVEIYYVPSKKDFTSSIRIKNIESKIPAHQLNIHTTLENLDSHKTIEFRNELRYSHGQFNGTPEAKFYIANGDITAFYIRIYPN